MPEHLSNHGCDVLKGINAIVQSSGGFLEGNLFYFHHSTPLVSDPPDDRRSAKRRNYLRVISGASTMLEIGFNAGHSALLALDSNSGIVYSGVDIGINNYALACSHLLKLVYGDRFSISFEDSRRALPCLLLDGLRRSFDVVHVDGGHDEMTAFNDISLALQLVSNGGLVLVDDTNHPEIKSIVDSMLQYKGVSLETFDSAWEGTESIALRYMK